MRKEFVDYIPKVTIKDGHAHVQMEDVVRCYSLTTFRRAVAQSVKILAAFDAGQKVVPIRRECG